MDSSAPKLLAQFGGLGRTPRFRSFLATFPFPTRKVSPESSIGGVNPSAPGALLGTSAVMWPFVYRNRKVNTTVCLLDSIRALPYRRLRLILKNINSAEGLPGEKLADSES